MRPPNNSWALPLASIFLAACGSERSRNDLRSAVPERRAAAVAALAGSRDAADLPYLLVAQQDPSPLVRKAAAAAYTARGGMRSVEALAALLEDPDPEVVVAAARGLGAVPQGASAQQGEAMQALARQQLVAAYGRAGPTGRAEIASALAATGTSLREAVEAEARQLWERNLKTLQAGSSSQRCGAAEELGRSGRAEAVRRLLPLAAQASAPRLAAAAARGLGGTSDPQAREALLELLDAPQAEVAEAAASALAELGDPAAAGPLARIGADGPSRLAAAAVEALAALPQAPDVGVALCEIAVRSLDPAVAEQAATQARARRAACPERPLVARLSRRGTDVVAALAAMGALGLAPSQVAQLGEPAAALLQSPEAAVRAAAARALGLSGHASAVPALQRRAQAVQQRAAEAREKWAAGPWAPAPAPGFDGGPPRAEAVLGRSRGAPAAVEGARPALQPEWVDDLEPGEVEELAAEAVALARLRAEGAGVLAASLTADPDEALRAASVEALAALGGDAGRRSAARALEDPAPRVRLAGAAALARGGAEAVGPLATALRRAAPADATFREALIASLSETGSPQAVEPLAELLSGPQAASAAVALGRLSVREGARPLLQMLERPGGPGRAEAVDALSQLVGAEAGEALAAELLSDRPEVRVAAARALGRVRFEGASQRLEALRSDYYGDVRRAAVEALARLPSGPTGRR
ncbi:MAG TPA: HEAT repeat domain-containing protein [Anaeromyxobacteraceae bacterium]|nr:HEAT repeat domain-containing protein [Anaeromyxobacteraceae bacterium]